MKSLLIAITLFTTVFTTTARANDKEKGVTPVVLQSFQNTFTTATEVGWSLTQESLYKAQFTLNAQSVTAFFQADGTMVALTRNLTTNELPISLQVNLKRDYTNFWVTDLFEIANDEGTNYYITVENADTKVVLKSSSMTWTTFQKLRKA